jgi:site-specific DNA-methyltransferase (adenine-specific)
MNAATDNQIAQRPAKPRFTPCDEMPMQERSRETKWWYDTWRPTDDDKGTELEPVAATERAPVRSGVEGLLDTVQTGDNVTVLATLPAECIDLVVTSPPYDDLRTYGGHSWDFEATAAQLMRVLKPGGVLVWVVADKTVDGSESGTSMEQALHFKRIGLRIHDTMIWNKYLPGLYGKRYTHAWEYMFVLSKGEPKAWNPIMRRNTTSGQRGGGSRGKEGHELNRRCVVEADSESIEENVWRIAVGGGRTLTDGSRHPAAFPETLASRHVVSWSNVGDVVLDPFAGSGTTLKAAKELNRHWLGIEINPAYVEICKARLSQDVLALFSGGGGAEQVGDDAATKQSGACSANAGTELPARVTTVAHNNQKL